MSNAIHATCVVVDETGILLSGPPGSGKSDLALRLIDRGARLVSDDYTVITRAADHLIATSPPTIGGLLEVRGIGIVHSDAIDSVRIGLFVSLADQIARMPPDHWHELIAGIAIPKIAVSAFEASAPLKIELAVKMLAST